MEEITIADVLLHYQNKLLEIGDCTNDLCTRFKTALALSESDWHGTAGRAAQDKLTELSALMNRVSVCISDAEQLLGGIKTTVAEETTTLSSGEE